MTGARARTAAAIMTVACAALPIWGAGVARSAALCTWGGTPDATTGTFTLEPGLNMTPAAAPLEFKATGVLEGEGCSGRMVFDGVVDTGSTCAFAIFEGRVHGLPGVAAFHGAGNVVAPSVLFDRDGNVAGTEHPQILTGVGNGSEASDCGTAEGFTDGNFSSVVQLFEER
jgi:hypothetical protein